MELGSDIAALQVSPDQHTLVRIDVVEGSPQTPVGHPKTTPWVTPPLEDQPAGAGPVLVPPGNTIM